MNKEEYLNHIASRAQFIANKFSSNSPELFFWRNKIIKIFGVNPETGAFDEKIAPFLVLDQKAQIYLLASHLIDRLTWVEALKLSHEAFQVAENQTQNQVSVQDNTQFDFITIRCDGASKGNPGPASCAFAVFDQKENIIHKHKEQLGNTTNNYAEYMGLVRAMEYVIKQSNFQELKVELDSELVVKQINGIYKIKKPELQELANKIFDILKKLKAQNKKYSFRHIPRELNFVADKLCNEALMK